jgi:ketosteroid isomerase-like protein
MTHTTFTDDDLARLIRDTREAAVAYIRGEIRRSLDLVPHASDYSLMPPYGGETMHGYNPTPEQIKTTTKFFAGPGEAQFDIEATYTSGALAVLVGVERQHGVVGGFPEQDWSLRVTLVFRFEGGTWYMVHRHADPLVHGITMDQVSALARGDS